MRPTVLLACMTLPLAMTAHSQSGRYAPIAAESESISYAYADVLSASPIYETYQSRVPVEQCRPVTVRSQSSRYDNTNTGTIVGAIVGGALGNTVGRGDGRRAATVAGAVIGGAVGREIDAGDNQPRTTVRTEERCEIVETIHSDRRIAGYDVSYRYRGEVYHSRLSYDPGAKLKIRVAVAPADY